MKGIPGYDNWKLATPPEDPEWLEVYQAAIADYCMYGDTPCPSSIDDAIRDLEEDIDGLKDAVKELEDIRRKHYPAEPEWSADTRLGD